MDLAVAHVQPFGGGEVQAFGIQRLAIRQALPDQAAGKIAQLSLGRGLAEARADILQQHIGGNAAGLAVGKLEPELAGTKAFAQVEWIIQPVAPGGDVRAFHLGVDRAAPVFRVCDILA